MTHFLRRASFLVVLGTLFIGENALAQGLLDYIRNYDLNDYALGITFSASQNPYLDGENSVIAYPVLTSFRDSAFTDDWLLLREGDVGLRWVTKSNWEMALIGRIQTLGLGTTDSPRLIGLDDRNWGLEMGPMVGWRGWPVHINLKTYTEVLGNHNGLISHLAFSLPHELERGYLVPSVELIHQNSDYASYYYGVIASEANALRPEYQPGDALNTALKLRWGYGITDRWLLYGSVGLEFLDSAITNSPIVEKDELWSASIAIAYNNDIFQPRISDSARHEQPRFEIRISAFSDSIDSTIVRDSSDGIVGTDIDLENLLGLPDEETLLLADAIFRIGTYHRLEVGYLETARNGSKTLANDITFGDETIPAGTNIDSQFDTKILRIGYAYSLINDLQKEVGIMAGLHFSRFETSISSPATDQVVNSNAATPLPVIGLHGSLSLGKKTTLGAMIQFFRMDYDRYEGSLNYVTLDIRRQFGDIFTVGLGYNYYALNLDSRDNDVLGTLNVRHHGPVLFVSAGF